MFSVIFSIFKPNQFTCNKSTIVLDATENVPIYVEHVGLCKQIITREQHTSVGQGMTASKRLAMPVVTAIAVSGTTWRP